MKYLLVLIPVFWLNHVSRAQTPEVALESMYADLSNLPWFSPDKISLCIIQDDSGSNSDTTIYSLTSEVEIGSFYDGHQNFVKRFHCSVAPDFSIEHQASDDYNEKIFLNQAEFILASLNARKNLDVLIAGGKTLSKQKEVLFFKIKEEAESKYPMSKIN